MGQIANRDATAYSCFGADARMRLIRNIEFIGREYAIPVEFSGLLPRSRYRLDAYRLRSLIYCSKRSITIRQIRIRCQLAIPRIHILTVIPSSIVQSNHQLAHWHVQIEMGRCGHAIAQVQLDAKFQQPQFRHEENISHNHSILNEPR